MEANQFMESLANAQKLMLDEEFNRKVESKAASFSGRQNNPNTSFQPQQAQPIEMIQAPISENRVNTRVPQAIRESFQNQPAMSGDDTQGYDTMSQITSKLSLQQPTPAMMTENAMPMQMVQQPIVSGIDYSLLKTIIDECVKRNLQEMKGSLNEGAIKGIKLGSGNKIQMLDTKGNLYEGVLKLVKKKE